MIRIITVLSVFLMISSTMFARPNRVNQFPNNIFVSNSCNACHTSGGGSPLTPFGKDVGATLNGNNVDWSKLFSLDSDGDGFTNGEELQDPNGEWTISDPNPGDPSLVTNPNDPEDFPTSIVEFVELDNIYPLPFTSFITLDLNIKQAGFLSISIFDINGNEIRTISENYSFGGLRSFTIQLNGLSNGTYYLRYGINENYAWEKLIK